MYLTIDSITGSHLTCHADVADGADGARVATVTCKCERVAGTFYFHVRVTPTTVTLSLVPGDWSDGLTLDLATVEISPDLIAATRRLHNMVGTA